MLIRIELKYLKYLKKIKYILYNNNVILERREYFIILKIMKFELDDMDLKDQIELMDIQRKMQQNTFKNNQTLGFNVDTIYDQIDNPKLNLE